MTDLSTPTTSTLTPTSTLSPEQALNVEFDYSPRFSYSFFQCGLSIVRSIRVRNVSDADLDGLRLSLSPQDAFAAPFSSVIPLLRAGECVNLSKVSLPLDAGFILQLTEQISSSLSLQVSKDESVLFSGQFPISILPFNQWTGLDVEPALLSSFVTPNEPSLAPVLHRAGEILKEWTHQSSLEGYQSRDADRVRKMVAAVFEALRELHILYSNPPASFGPGQRIRLSQECLQTSMGTCIDTSVLVASCLEQIGLNSLLVLVSGHAFVGSWLVSDMLPYNVSDDPSLLSKHLALGEIVLLESTFITDGSGKAFDDAALAITPHLQDLDSFQCVIDVARCRYSGILPLPVRSSVDGVWTIVQDTNHQEEQHEKPHSIDRWEIEVKDEGKLSKRNVWERKLLDLSLRNSLLNFRMGGRSMALLSTNVGAIEDALYLNSEFSILPLPPDFGAGCEEDAYNVVSAFPPQSQRGVFLLKELERGNLYSTLSEADNKAALKALYRNAKVGIEENGANTLYMAIGLLRWFEQGVKTPRYAPILLVPVDLVRRGTGYIVRSRHEETILNVTLLEMLRQSFEVSVGGLDPLPTDEAGIDVPLVMAIFRKAVINMPLWDVVDVVALGNFSFSKFIMWNDIHNNIEALRQNQVVRSLEEGRLCTDAVPLPPDAYRLDQSVAPNDLALPVPCDSSQLEAVHAASTGQNFILHGAPGTGKSQTITNMIANALYHGKRVLFAAEKMAALEVVQKRLAKIGLAPFCLQVHSNKANKSDVLSQLQQSVDVTRVKAPEQFEAEAAKLFELRKQLNAYVEALHKKSACGLSVYDAVSRFCAISSDEDGRPFQFPVQAVSSLQSSQLDRWLDGVEQLSVVAQSCGHPATHKLRMLNFDAFSPDLASSISSSIDESTRALALIPSSLPSLPALPPMASRQVFDLVGELLQLLSSQSGLNANLVLQSDAAGNADKLSALASHGKRALALRQQLLATYNEDVFKLNAEQLLNQWRDVQSKWFFAKWLGSRSLQKQLAAYSHNPGAVSLDSDLPLLASYAAEQRVVAEDGVLLPLFGSPLPRSQEQWDSLVSTQAACVRLHSIFASLTGSAAQVLALKQQVAMLLHDGYRSFSQTDGRKFAAIAEAFASLSASDAALQQVAGLDPGAVLPVEGGDFIVGRSALLLSLSQNLGSLKDWFQFLSVRHSLQHDGLGFWVSEVSSNASAPASDWTRQFKRGLYASLTQFLVGSSQALAMFKGDIFESTINKYREFNSRYQSLVQGELYARLAQNIPNFTIEASSSSEVGILQRALRNKGRGLALRALFDSVPNLLSRLCPCMLMSPMSIAQFLDVAKQQPFDIVIFDEASQMPTCEAVGAIARGKNVIVVGDPKQMPPTSFFSAGSSSDDDDALAGIDDLESILEDCMALSIPNKHLLFHYRSKHESLISFSNNEYYDGRLCTFPSADSRLSRVSMVRIRGSYDKGHSRQNKAEAQAVVSEVVRRLRDPALCHRSIGVVTFSQTQQALVDDLLTEALAHDSVLDERANKCDEPLFVKNLENVQGDERDVILFSVGYGPDASGNVSMNFGPLNKVGGERRLNVAVSRARYDMVVFSSITADMIDLNRTQALGVKGLKEFLKYAEAGVLPVPSADASGSAGRSSVSLASSIALELRGHGFDVDTQVGNSAFRVDVAVADPDNKGSYLLGILTDGENYCLASTARDREVCQPTILSMLGWNLARVWSIDWWEDRQRVVSGLLRAIEDAKQGRVAPPIVSAQPLPALEAVADDAAGSSNGLAACEYNACVLKYNNSGSDGLRSPSALGLVARELGEIIRAEEPVNKTYAFRRVAQAFGSGRLTASLVSYLDEKVLPLVPCYVQRSSYQDVLWTSEGASQSFSSFREKAERDAPDIPIVEFVNAMKAVLSQQVSLPGAELKRQAAKLIGFGRTGTVLDSVLEQALSQLSSTGAVVSSEGMFKLA